MSQSTYARAAATPAKKKRPVAPGQRHRGQPGAKAPGAARNQGAATTAGHAGEARKRRPGAGGAPLTPGGSPGPTNAAAAKKKKKKKPVGEVQVPRQPTVPFDDYRPSLTFEDAFAGLGGEAATDGARADGFRDFISLQPRMSVERDDELYEFLDTKTLTVIADAAASSCDQFLAATRGGLDPFNTVRISDVTDSLAIEAEAELIRQNSDEQDPDDLEDRELEDGEDAYTPGMSKDRKRKGGGCSLGCCNKCCRKTLEVASSDEADEVANIVVDALTVIANGGLIAVCGGVPVDLVINGLVAAITASRSAVSLVAIFEQLPTIMDIINDIGNVLCQDENFFVEDVHDILRSIAALNPSGIFKILKGSRKLLMKAIKTMTRVVGKFLSGIIPNNAGLAGILFERAVMYVFQKVTRYPYRFMVKMLEWFGLKGILIGDPESVERNMMQMVNDLVGQLHAVNKRMQKGGWCRLCAAYSCCYCKWLLCPVWITATCCCKAAKRHPVGYLCTGCGLLVPDGPVGTGITIFVSQPGYCPTKIAARAAIKKVIPIIDELKDKYIPKIAPVVHQMASKFLGCLVILETLQDEDLLRDICFGDDPNAEPDLTGADAVLAMLDNERRTSIV